MILFFLGAFLCTPTDLHCIPDSARAAAQSNGAGLLALPFALLCKVLSMGKFLKSNVNPKVGELAYVDGISVAQVILPAPPSYHSTTPAVPHSLFLSF